MNDYVHISKLEEANSNSRRVHTYTHLHMEYYHSTRLTHICVWESEGQERILLCYTREEFNLVEWTECEYIERKRKRTSSNCSSRLQVYTRSVCVSSTTFVCWFVPVIELDSRHFPFLNRVLILHTGRSLIINYQRHTHAHSTRKKNAFSVLLTYY
jgi:hypothetical protein